MRVLVTNDDGVEAPGLLALTEAVVAAGHDAIVVAPTGQCSGSGAAIGRLHRSGPIACTSVHWPSVPDVPVYALDVVPAAAVYAGCLGSFGPPPDAVASGVNPGLNYGHLVLHSGTVGAALTAATLGLPGVAVSIAWHEEPRWRTAAALVPPALEWAAAHAPGQALSLNVPDVEPAELRGVRPATLAPYMETWRATHRPGEVTLEYVGHAHEPPAGSDLALVHDGYAALTLLRGVMGVEASDAADHLAAAAASYALRS